MLSTIMGNVSISEAAHRRLGYAITVPQYSSKRSASAACIFDDPESIYTVARSVAKFIRLSMLKAYPDELIESC